MNNSQNPHNLSGDGRVTDTASSGATSVSTNILNMSREELTAFFTGINHPEYRVTQLLQWLYKKHVDDFDAMSNFSKQLRELLKQTFHITLPVVSRVDTDPEDGTRKLLLKLPDGIHVESVIIFEDKKTTLCLSSQAGCPLHCQICHTGLHGYIRNLTQGEIIAQLLLSQQLIAPENITNLVVMGMGEPFLNYRELSRALNLFCHEHAFGMSPRRITVSTSGIIPGIQKFGADFPRMNLAISLNATTDKQRIQIMPIAKKFPLEELLAACRNYPLPPRKRITFEYVLIRGLNDSVKDAKRLSSILRGIRCKVNLIPLNDKGLTGWQASEPSTIDLFQRTLADTGYTVLLRKSKGSSILAACGQLAGVNSLERP